jgi:hypothetical protein
VRLSFENKESNATTFLSGNVEQAIFGSQQYHWNPAYSGFNAHSPLVADAARLNAQGHADPDGPVSRNTMHTGKDTVYVLPPASIVVLRGKIEGQ